MKINENFVSRFLNNIMKGVISKKEKDFLKSNPEIAKKVKDLKNTQAELTSLISNLSK